MSYQVLARKWRPRTFRELVGQQHVLQALVNALDHDRLHHAYLFTGTRGVGKTTIARILARCLNCETGVSSEPCGQCGACTEINEGRFIDLIEVDAASRTKVEDTRELLENVQYAPTRGRYKVYLIDEVHMLSTHSFNALLKTLEEPPPHVKFLLATTDPQKLPVTILSRCLQFHLKNMEPERIVGHLQHVLEQEMVPFEEPALWQIGRSADGSMRDALSLTDQAIAYGGGKITEQDVITMLGAIDQSLMYQVLSALADSNAKDVFAAVAALSEHAPDYSSALADLLSILHRIAIAQTLPEAIDNHQGDQDKVLALAQVLPAEDVQLFYQTALLGRRDLPLSPSARIGFEMVLLRMLAFRPQGVHSVPTQALPQANDGNDASQTESMEGSTPPKKFEADTEQSVSKAIASSMPKIEPQPEIESQPEIEPQPAIEVKSAIADAVLPVVDKRGLSGEQLAAMGLQPARQIPMPKNEPAAAQALPEAQSIGGNDAVALEALTPELWLTVYKGLNVGGVLQSTVSNCQLMGRQDNEVHFMLDENNSTLYDEIHQQRLSDLLSDYFSQPVKAVIQLGSVNYETPATRSIKLKQENFERALKGLNSDPFTQALVEQYDAKLDIESIEPRSLH